MSIQLCSYTPADFIAVRDFLVRNHAAVGEQHNWHIARWDFARYVSQVFHASGDLWSGTVGIWRDDACDIVAVVNSEGEADGEVHFQLATLDLPDCLHSELFAHAEAKLACDIDGRRVVRPVLSDANPRLQSIASQLGYAKTEHREVVLTIDPRRVPTPSLPAGLRFADGREVSPEQQSRAHAAAFGIEDDSIYIPRSRVAFAYLREAPDYRPELDIYVVGEGNEPVSFCCMWYDHANRAGHLEPVGTNPLYRRMGLGRAAIYEGLRRIAAEGALTATVGSTQQFYKSIGFELLGTHSVWEKTI